MTTKSHYLISIILLLNGFISSEIMAQFDPNGIDSLKAAIDAEYNELLDDTKVIGASIAIIDNGVIVYANGFGFSDLENDVQVTPETIFPIGSSTKTFTAFAVMQLHEKGLLDINKSIKEYIPELTISSHFNDGNEIFIKDILSHSSSLPSDILNGMMSNEKIDINWSINELNKQSTIAPFLFIDAYSNIGYALLGELIHRVSGLTYESYLKENIFKPLGMMNTNAGFNEKMSKGYVKKEESVISGIRDSAAGCITSTSLDMAIFVKMLLEDGVFNGGQFVSKETITAMEKDYMKDLKMETSEAYGYGVNIFTAELKSEKGTVNQKMFGHSGYAPPFHADYRYIPKLGIGVVVMTNTRSSPVIRSAGSLLKVYLKEAKGIDYQLMFKSVDIENNCVDADIPGFYSIGVSILEVKNLNKIKFKIEGNKIVLKRKDTSFNYYVKALLLGFIPIKAKGTEFRFIKKDGEMYLSQKDLDRNHESYIGAKVKKVKVPVSWRAVLGEYEIVKSYPCNDSEFDFANAKVTLSEKDGFVLLDIKTKTGEFPFYLNIDASNIAYTGGMGRQMGYTVKILDNGNLYFSGFEFKLKK